MELRENFGVAPAKLEDVLSRMRRLGIAPAAIEESFSRGGGPGGQKINKTSNCVRLSYAPLGLSVRTQRERSRSLNRFLALRELVDRIEMKISPETSRKLKEIARQRRRKARRRQRTSAKYANGGPAA
ncbi:MAG: peptide chain release factor-like protein [Elusimicrobia bacterium]|nr:peptide chain release factor-like protein [Elusimicrobiota bacterium]MDE2314759.1 peptide chain release factor-like protein [Elusimicrobiota bacterium]